MAGQIPTKGAVGQRTPLAKKTPAKAPGKAIAKAANSDEKSDFTPARAKAHTDKIKKGATTTFEDIKKAYLGRIWLALGHKNWDEYCDKEFDGVPLALPRESKKAAVASLHAAGMSSRAIAAATDVPQQTAVRYANQAAASEGD